MTGWRRFFTEERKTNPSLDSWFDAWFCSDYAIEDLKECAPGTVGGIYHQASPHGGYDVQIVPNFKPKSQWEYYSLRAGQTHDYEHILAGGGFNYVGELLPYWFRLATIDQHIQNKELAGEMNVMGILGVTRHLIRTVLHYPETWGAALKCIEQGIAIGRNSDPFWMARMEDVWHTPLDEARRQLGVRGALDLDTEAEGQIWSGLQSGSGRPT